MQNKQKIVSAIALVTCGGMGGQAQAVLPDDAILKFDPPVLGGYYGNVIVGGSFFGMDTSSDSAIQPGERTGLVVHTGITLGKAQAGSGSHPGAPNGSESPGIDKPWNFFGNTGLDLTTVAPTIINDDGAGAVTLDFSGWTVSWNGIDAIPLGSRSWNGNPDGVAIMTCDNDCAEGDRYILDFSATVPDGDPSGFDNVKYLVHFEGEVTIPPALTVDSGTPSPGSIAVAAGSTDGRITIDDVINSPSGIADPDFSYGAGLLDFVVTGITGTTVAVVIPQTAPIPANSVYRKFLGSAWTAFVVDANNLIASAPSVAGVCPSVNDVAYTHTNGLVEGDNCVQLTIEDGGSNDADSAIDSNITDPGGVATPVQEQVDTRTSGTSGCSITGGNSSVIEHADWWLVAGFIGLLGMLRLKRDCSSDKA